MNTATLERMIVDIDTATLAEVKEWHSYAKASASSYQTAISRRPLWRDMRTLLQKEINRYK